MSRETLFNLRPYFTGLSSWRGILSEAVCTFVFLCVCGVSGHCWGGAGWCDCNYGGVVGGGFMVGQALAGFQRSCCKT